MPHLTVTMPDDLCGTVNFALEGPVAPAGSSLRSTPLANGTNLQFSSTRILHDGHSLVLRGNLSWTGEYTGPTDIVCKLVPAYRKTCKRRMEREAMFYETRLLALQGKCVPKFFGYYTGICKETNELTNCILLEYCGELITGTIDKYPMEIRLKACCALQQIHEAGVEHNDLDERDQIVIQGDEIRFIDFDRARKHKCDSCHKLYPYDFEPGLNDFSCGELYEFAFNYDIWTPVGVEISCVVISLYNHPDVESLFKRCQAISSLWPDEVVRGKVCQMLDEYCEQYNDRFDILFGPVAEDSPAATAAAFIATNPNPKTAELRRKLAWLKDWNKAREADI